MSRVHRNACSCGPPIGYGKPRYAACGGEAGLWTGSQHDGSRSFFFGALESRGTRAYAGWQADAVTDASQPPAVTSPETSPETPPVTLLTDGVVTLRAHSVDDADAIVEQSSDPESLRWTTVPRPYAR